MQEELDALKLQIKEIALRETRTPNAASYSRPIRFKVQDVLDYSPSEISTQVEFDLPVTTKEIEKLVGDQTVMR